MIFVNAIAVIVYLLFSWYLLRTYREHFVLFCYFSFMSTWALISCFYNDTGIFNLELFRFTETTLATSRLAGFYIIFNLGFLVMARLLAGRDLARIDYAFSCQTLQLGHFKFFIYAAAVIVIFYLTYTMVTDGIPIFSGLNRLEYFQQANFLEQKLLFYAPPIAFVLGYYRRKRGRFSINSLIMAAFTLFAILVGNKFSLLVAMLIYYFLPIYVRYLADHPDLRLFSWRQVLAMGTVTGVLLMLSFGIYFNIFKDVSHSYNLLVNRVFAFQGQMWWAVDHDVSLNGRYDDDHWQVELNNIISGGDTPAGEVGMRYIMVKTLGPEKAYEIFDRGYLYTHTYPAILIATFPYGVAVAIQFLAGMLFFTLLYYFYYSIRYRHALRAIIAMLIIIPFVATLFSGNFTILLTLGLIVKLAVIAVLEFPAFMTGSRIEN